ncbi:MAG: TonB family protein, partial [Bacteroidales bacterium]|nr:TonB family protein [Bacteroidales bacterium]
MGSLITALILPVFTIPGLKAMEVPQVFGISLSDILISGSQSAEDTANKAPQLEGYQRALLFIYLSGVAVVLLKLIVDIVYLLYLVSRNRSNAEGIVFFKGFETPGFSALGYIFINERLEGAEADEIIKHEKNHLTRYHFIDIIIIELIKAFQWFNPFIYLFERSLREIHEYQADEGCLSSGIHPLSYQTLLLSQVFKSKAFRVTDSFSYPSLIKKRMIMMTKERTGSMANLKIFLVLPVVAAALYFISSCDKKSNGILLEPPIEPIPAETIKTSEGDVQTYVVVEEMPQFPGGDLSLLKYIAENTTYPAEAKEKGIQGRVIVRFTVNADGTVGNSSVLKGVDPLLDAEALRVVNSLPSFSPGKQGGVPVPVWYMVPITFMLNTEKTPENVTPPPPPPPPAENKPVESINP